MNFDNSLALSMCRVSTIVPGYRGQAAARRGFSLEYKAELLQIFRGLS
jgi:hypothetical protein